MESYWTLKTGVPEDVDLRAQIAYKEIILYVTKFLCAKHPFRDGDVCPFVREAIRIDTLYFTHFPPGLSKEECMSILRATVSHYEVWKQQHKALGAIIVFFFEKKSERWIKSIHRKLAGEVMQKGLILGNLHPESPSHSFHSKHWFPLRSPYPMFLVRDMISSDKERLKASGTRDNITSTLFKELKKLCFSEKA